MLTRLSFVPALALLGCGAPVAPAQADVPSAQAQLRAASDLAKLRATGDVCSTEAYQSAILDDLKGALAADPSLRSSLADPSFDSVRHTVRFAALAGADLSTADGVRSALTDAPLYSYPVSGVYGASMILKPYPDGSLDVGDLRDVDGDIVRVTRQGTWALDGTTVLLRTGDATWALTVHADGTLTDAAGIVQFDDDLSECEV